MTCAVAIAHFPILLGQIVFHRDPAHWTFPARWFVRDAILRGDSPFWNPLQGLGFSTLGNPLYGIFYPPNWLYLATPIDWVASMVTWQSLAHLLWGAFGTMALARRLGATSLGVAVAGLAWSLSGLATTSWNAGLLLLAYAWVPWVAVGFFALAGDLERSGRAWWGGVAKAAAPIGMAILLGEVFVAMMAVGFGLATLAAARWAGRAGAPAQATTAAAVGPLPADGPPPAAIGARWRWPAALGLAVALGGALGAIVVLPARAISAATDRAAPLPLDLAEVCSMHPLRLLELFVPGVLGSPTGFFPGARWLGEDALGKLPLFYSLYAGAGVMLLAACALGRRRRLAGALAALWLVAVLIALGKHTPVHAALRGLIPPLAYMRYPEKYAILFSTWGCLLAGLGADRLWRERGASLRRPLALLAALALLGVAGRHLAPSELADSLRRGALQGALFAGLLVFAFWTLRRWPRPGRLLIVAVVAVDLAAMTFREQVTAPRDTATRVPRAAEVVRHEAPRPAPPRVYRHSKIDDKVGRFVEARSITEGQIRALQTLLPNEVTTYGIGTVPGYDAAIPSAFPGLWLAGMKTGQVVLRLLSVAYAVLPVEDPAAGDKREGLRRMLDPLPGARLYRVDDVLPRVYLAGRAEIHDGDAAAKRIFSPDVVFGETVVLSPASAAAALAGPPGRAGDCALESFANGALRARCTATRAAIAVFVEQYDPGWVARIDGRPASIERVNAVLRGVAVPPGEHVVELAYRPRILGGAAGLSLAAFAGLLACLAAAFAGRRRPAG